MDSTADVMKVFTPFDRWFVPGFLAILCSLSAIWSIFIIKMVITLFTKGKVDDIREKKEENKKD